jgi:hypothetical protein
VRDDANRDTKGGPTVSQFIVQRREGSPTRHSLWREVRTVEAVDAAAAFRAVVLDPERETVAVGEYMILSLDGAWRVGAEITLRDLSEDPTR